jgi:hypothetical protein
MARECECLTGEVGDVLERRVTMESKQHWRGHAVGWLLYLARADERDECLIARKLEQGATLWRKNARRFRHSCGVRVAIGG